MYGLKTLAVLDVKPGDVVLYHSLYEDNKHYTVMDGYSLKGEDGKIRLYASRWHDAPWFTLVSRASETPKTWAEMTPEEKGALLLAAHDGKVIEYADEDCGWNFSNCYAPLWSPNFAYRVKPEPKRDTVTGAAGKFDGKWFVELDANKSWLSHRITFDLIDGEPDCASIKMERI